MRLVTTKSPVVALNSMPVAFGAREDFLYVVDPALTGRTGGVAAVHLSPPARTGARTPAIADQLEREEAAPPGTNRRCGHE